MREIWAQRIALLTGGLVVVLAVVFAYTQNPPRRQSGVQQRVVPALPPPPLAAEPEALSAGSPRESGQRVYADQSCARCHSIAGRGGARSALDGVGARLTEEEIRAWVVPHAKSETGFQARHADIRLTPTQREALVAYLRSLR